MGWETRGAGGRTYLYLSRRDAAGKPVKVYVGGGRAAADAARALAGRKAAREAGRRALADARDGTRAADELSDELTAAAVVLAEACLLAAGYHRPNYGPWRRRRDGHGRRDDPAGGRAGGDHGGGRPGEGG